MRRGVRKKTPGVRGSRGSVYGADSCGAAPQRANAVQKLLPVRGGLKAYLAAPDMLVDASSRECPFCRDGHRLQLHGHYHRYVLVDGDADPRRIPVRRLLCVPTGRTVSLLPCFCVPRRQHGTAVLARFLEAYAAGASLKSALLATRPDAPDGHSTAQSLRAGFLSRAGPIRTYLASRRARAAKPPVAKQGPRGAVTVLLAALRRGFSKVVDAFVRHGIGLHAMQRIGLA